MTTEPPSTESSHGSAGPSVDPAREQTGQTEPTRRTLLGRLVGVLLWVLLSVIVLLLLAMVGIPKLMGWVPLTVLSTSMEPTYPIGSQIVVERVQTQEDFDALQVGDVITFMPNPDDGTLVTHRIVQSVHNQDGSRTVITQGDANPSPDPHRLDLTQIRGTVRYHIPYVGYLAQRLTTDQKSTGAIVLAVGLFGYAAYHLTRSGLDLRRSRKEAAAGLTGEDGEQDTTADLTADDHTTGDLTTETGGGAAPATESRELTPGTATAAQKDHHA